VEIDLPTGATMVCTFGIVLILMASVRGLVRKLFGAAHEMKANVATVASNSPVE
jgi:hypothetical protein